MTRMNRKIMAYTLVTLAIVTLGAAGILIKKAQQYAPSLTIATLRNFLATFILIPFIFRPGWKDRMKFAPRKLLLSALAGIFLGLHFWAWFVSLEHTMIANGMTILNTQPVIAAVLSYVFLKEKPEPKIIIAIIVAMVGVFIIGFGDFQFSSGKSHLFGDAVAFGAATASCIYLMIGRSLRKKHDLLPYIFVVYGFSSLTLLVATVSSGTALFGYSSELWIWVVLLAVGPSLIGHTALNWSVKFLPVYVVTMFMLAELVISAALGWYFLCEIPTVAMYIGAAFIFGALFITVFSQRGRPEAS